MKKSILAFVLFFLTNTFSFSQIEDTICAAHYNLENLFDTVNDTLKEDEEFLPESNKAWTEERLNQKLFNLARVIRSVNNFNGPDILGLCEVEHQYLLDTLVIKYLSDKYYKTAYAESPDNRGIDNGLIYNADKFILLSVSDDTVHLSDGYPTRGILNVKLLSRWNDTVWVFVNHWPSRRGGDAESEKNRIAAAQVLRNRVDSLLLNNPETKIFILGDFNDEPNNNSILKILGAGPFECNTPTESDSSILFNTAYSKFAKGEGSYKYRDDWNMLDQVIISRSLINGDFHYVCNSFEIFKPDFILTKTGDYAGTSIPTFGGSRYLGGYSDHFLVMAKFVLKR